MLSLIFKFFCWWGDCQSNLFLLSIKIYFIIFSLLILVLIKYFINSLLWKNKLKSVIKFQEDYCLNTAPLIDVAKIALLSINNLKNPLTSLRLILDELKDPEIIKNTKKLREYLDKADSLLLSIKKKEELLNKQLSQKNEQRLFALTEEINSILNFYQNVLKEHSIKLTFISSKEYRIFANQDQLLRIINSVLLNRLESLILAKKEDKFLKIYLKRTPYFLKIFIEDNVGFIDFSSINACIKINYSNIHKLNNFQPCLYFANHMMSKYFYKEIKIKNKMNKKMLVCLKIKNSFILAEQKIIKNSF